MYKNGKVSERDRQTTKDLIIQGDVEITSMLASAEVDGGTQLRAFLAEKAAGAAAEADGSGGSTSGGFPGGDASSAVVDGMTSELSELLRKGTAIGGDGAAMAQAGE